MADFQGALAHHGKVLAAIKAKDSATAMKHTGHLLRALQTNTPAPSPAKGMGNAVAPSSSAQTPTPLGGGLLAKLSQIAAAKNPLANPNGGM